MDKEQIIKNLKLLANLEAGGTPANSWRAKNREIFLMQVKNSRQNLPVKEVHTAKEHILVYARMFFKSPWMRQNVFRPSAIGLSSLVVVFTGWIASVSASINSVPGDILYPLKRATEVAQLTLTTGTENKTALQFEFADRRLEEVSKITESSDADQKNEDVQYAVAEFKNNINNVKDNLEALKASASPETVAALAKMVDRKTDEYSTQLDRAALTSSESVQSNLESAKKAVEETGVKAVEVMVSHTTSVIGAEELKQKLEEKISQLEGRVTADDKMSAASSTITDLDSADAKKSLDAARTLIAANNLLGALQEVKVASKIILGESSVVTATSSISVPVSETSTPAVANTTVKPTVTNTTSSSNIEVQIQFIPDSTSLDWLEAQIMSQDFKPADKPNEQEDVSVIIK